MEHPQAVSEENSNNYNSFTSTSESSTNAYNSTVDSSSQNRKETDGSDMSFRYKLFLLIELTLNFCLQDLYYFHYITLDCKSFI